MTNTEARTTWLVEYCAAAAHETNRLYCLAHDDDSQVHWHDAPGWQRESARKGARLVLQGEERPSAIHEAWMAEKIRDGWVHGSVKNAEAKTHPCLLPYDQLPQEQRAKDTLFAETVRLVAKTLRENPPRI